MLYRRYPILVEDPIQFLRDRLGYSDPLKLLSGDREVLELAEKRAISRLSGEDWAGAASSEYEVASLLMALVASLKASRLALSRFIEGEVSSLVKSLEGEDIEVLVRVASALGVRVDRGKRVRIPWIITRGRIYYRVLDLSTPLPDALEYMDLDEDSIASLFILEGRVYLDRRLLINLISGLARRRLYSIAESLSDLEAPGIMEIVSSIKSYMEHGVYAVKGVDISAFPECIRNIMDKAKNGMALSDEEVYIISTFLSNINADVSILEEVLVSGGLVRPELAPIIVPILYEEASKFRPYNCRRLRELGYCECRISLIAEYWSNLRKAQDHG